VRYQAAIEGAEVPVEIDETSAYHYRVRVGERELDVDAVNVEGHAVSLLVNGRSFDVDLEPDAEGEGLNVLIEDEVFRLEVLDERRLRMRAARAHFTVSGPQTLLSPMPGKVVRVLCAPGAQVKAGEGLVVVEAMKMENELKSPRDGVVKEVLVKEGQPVEGGARLVVVA
jgi:biotin carboxyl carrier protein